MKKRELKKLLKYMAISILIVYFAVGLVTTIINFVDSYTRVNYWMEENITDIRYVTYLEEKEEVVYKIYDGIAEDVDEDYPAMGAAVDQLTILLGVNEMEMFALSVVVGMVTGATAYLMKKEYKKTVHHIAMFILIFVTLSLIILLTIHVIEYFKTYEYMGYTMPYAGDYFYIMGITIIPYTIMYVVVCLIVFLVNKKRAETLNEYVKDNSQSVKEDK